MARIVKRKLGYYAELDVPRALQKALGKTRVRSLKTRVHAEAVTRSRQIIADLQGEIDAKLRQPAEALSGEAEGWKEAVMSARRGEEAVTGLPEGEAQEGFIMGLLQDRTEAVAAKHGDVAAKAFAGHATGQLTPLLHHLPDWLREGGRKGPFQERTKGSNTRALKVLEAWMKEDGLPPSIQAIKGRREAGRFVTGCLVKSGRHPKTIASIVSVCRSYWAFLDRKGLVAEAQNPWDGAAPSKAAGKGVEDDDARAFTNEEVSRLLAGPADVELADLMTVAALTGMRINEAYELTVRDCAEGLFNIRAAKTQAGKRRVPIHSGLTGIIARRCEGKPLQPSCSMKPGSPTRGGSGLWQLPSGLDDTGSLGSWTCMTR